MTEDEMCSLFRFSRNDPARISVQITAERLLLEDSPDHAAQMQGRLNARAASSLINPDPIHFVMKKFE